jgi:UDP-N-acetyl-D-glucosamine dehydrogenase
MEARGRMESLVQEKIARIEAREFVVGVVGLGYVGLPLALSFVESGFKVLGFDVDPDKNDALAAGATYIRHIPAERIGKAMATGRLTPTADFTLANKADAVLICVPTPLDEHRNPDLHFVEETGRQLAPHLKKGALVCLESTTYPGTTEELLGPILEEGSGFKAGDEFFLAFSPEREDPNNPDFSTGSIPKIVGGLDEASQQVAVALYSAVIDSIVPVSSCAVAEASKLLENIFRSVNIALVNEMKVLLGRMGIDVWEVIAAASTKPFGFMPFYPGPGLGGHCIPIDPFYLTWRARQFGATSRFIELAGEINTFMPEYVVNKTIEGLNSEGKALNGAKLLIVGLSYKPNIDDTRESPSLELIRRFESLGAKVEFHDPYLPAIPKTRKFGNLTGRKSRALHDLSVFDAIVISTAHDAVDHEKFLEADTLIVDTRNALGGKTGTARVVKA